MINLIEELAEIMQERSVDLCKAYELINGNKISKNSKKINWEAIIDEFKNDERGNRRGTTKAGLKLRMERTLLALNTKPIPRNAEQLFKNYAQLFLIELSQKAELEEKELWEI